MSVLALLGACDEEASRIPAPAPSPASIKKSAPAQKAPASENALEFFNSLSGTLEVELSEPTQRIGKLRNEKALPSARLLGVELKLEVREGDHGRALRRDELERVVHPHPEISLRGLTGPPVKHQAPNGKHFTVGDLLHAVEDTELETRGDSEWLGGVDAHHVFFEGLRSRPDGTYDVLWGS